MVPWCWRNGLNGGFCGATTTWVVWFAVWPEMWISVPVWCPSLPFLPALFVLLRDFAVWFFPLLLSAPDLVSWLTSCNGHISERSRPHQQKVLFHLTLQSLKILVHLYLRRKPILQSKSADPPDKQPISNHRTEKKGDVAFVRFCNVVLQVAESTFLTSWNIAVVEIDFLNLKKKRLGTTALSSFLSIFRTNGHSIKTRILVNKQVTSTLFDYLVPGANPFFCFFLFPLPFGFSSSASAPSSFKSSTNSKSLTGVLEFRGVVQ